ncbi:MAG TPA: DNA polymerase III subunit gamma/tau [Flavipsychrobacter sp.]|nr:DNA polymerase III subunit gamma/tau [Flavipsychrobacter sp.]
MAENYIVSARKYRPQAFDTVVGQAHITTTLKNAIRHQHLAHAYLFCGPRGVGKTTCARILAKTINCENLTAEMEACNVCTSCVSFNNNGSFNIFELDAASNNSVEDIRELVNQVRFAPQQGRYKIYIIDEVHMLSTAAFNAFLKTLEEPPAYAIFILATTEKHKILPTILSRCQIFDFKRITTDDIVVHLHGIATKEGMIAQESALHVVAQKSEGCMRDALSMLDRIASFTNGQLTYTATMEHLNMLDADFYFALTDHLLSQDVSGALLALDSVLEKGFEGNVILEGLAEHMRNLLLCKDQRMVRLLDVPNDHKPVYFEKANQTPPSFILSALNILNDTELNYKSATNKRLHVEMCLIRLCFLLQATSAAEVKKKLSGVGEPNTEFSAKKNIAENPAPVYTPQNSSQKTQVAVQEIQGKKLEAPVAKAVSSQPIPDVPSTSIPQLSGRRISKNLMSDIDAAVSSAVAVTMETKELTDELIQKVYEQYKQKLQLENKSVYHAQFSSMKAEQAGADEIKIIAPNELTEEYAKEQRNQLIEYFREHTGIMVRVTTEVRKDENNQQIQHTVLSKTEVFEMMAQKNPNLRVLKEALNLQIEY